MAVDLCYVISHGFAARMVLQSTLVAELCARGLKVGVIAPDIEEGPLRSLADAHGLQLATTPDLGRRTAWFGKVRPYLFEDVRQNPALWSKHQRATQTGRRSARLSAHLRLGLNRAILAAPSLSRLVSKYETALLRHPDAVAAVAALQPRAVVATYPVDPREAACLLAAREAGIDTVIHLLSWDNITSKGHLGVLADHYLAWGPIMASEFTERYGVRPEQISQVGVPHFDAHVRAVHPDLTRDAVAGLGLDPSAPYLFFGMSSPVTSPHEIDVVEWLAEGIEAGRFGSLTQLLVRPHPQNVRGHMADLAWLPRLDALASKRVAIDYPTIAKSRMLWSMNPEDLARLVNLIAGSAITLNSGSTLAIDAMVQDKPVIVTAFDAGRDLPWWCSASRVVDYVHLKKLFALGGVSVVHGFAELGAAIDRYLANPEADAEGRARSRAEQLFAADDRASARAADALASLLAR